MARFLTHPGLQPEAQQPPPLPPAVEHRFEFRGDAREYFRIWIVNVALTIASLGIYSAWAKVRTQRYFHGNTWVAGHPFAYQAPPLAILKGRAVALLLFGSYAVAGRWFPGWQVVPLAAIALATPWLVVKSLRFRARYTAWSGLNFRFMGTTREAYRCLLLYLLVPLTLGMPIRTSRRSRSGSSSATTGTAPPGSISAPRNRCSTASTQARRPS